MRKSGLLLVAIAFCFGTAQATVPVSQRDALVRLYNATNGPGWYANDGWNSQSDPCTWARVTCAVDPNNPNIDNIQILLLNDNNLVGHVDVGLDDLVHLEYLYFKGNSFPGTTIPLDFGNFTDLLTLDLWGCELEGTIPAVLANITTLRNLFLQENELTGEIPPELGSMPNLEWLYMHANQLTGEIPPELGSLPNLKRLWIQNNGLEGDIPTELGDLPNIEHLHMHGNRLVGEIPVELGNLSTLQELYLADNLLTGEIPPVLSTLPVLLRLNMEGNLLVGNIPPELGSTTNLRMLFLGRNLLEGEIPPELGELEFLRLLGLSHNRLSGLIPPEIGSANNLERLFVQSNRLIGQVPTSLDQTSLANGDGLDLRWNALYNTDPDLEVFLFSKQIGVLWEGSQTVAPTGLRAAIVGDYTVQLGWDPLIEGTPEDGGFETFYRPAGGSTWISGGWTTGKDVLAMPVTGLAANTNYDFTVATYTSPHADNDNRVVSEVGDIVTEQTNDNGCDAPVIAIDWSGPGATLSVTPAFATYLWSTGDLTPTISVNPAAPEYFWVTVTDGGSCSESDIVLVAPALFVDGFESGDTTGWSDTTP